MQGLILDMILYFYTLIFFFFFFNNESSCKLEPKHQCVSFLGLISIQEIMPPQNICENPSTLHHTKVDFRSHASRDSVSSTQTRVF